MKDEKKNIRVVIGANYGDEGKGLMTDYFCRLWPIRPKKHDGVVVLSNGGAQRGHTVETPSRERVVFHHFGSGHLVGYDTYCPENFIINPAQFVQEKLSLDKTGDFSPWFIVHTGCRWSTPFDMILNQARLIKDDRANSTGFGVWETVKRYRYFKENNIVVPSLKQFVEMSYAEKDVTLAMFLDYFYRMLDVYQIDPNMNPKMKELFGFDPMGLVKHFIQDCEYMHKNVLFTDNDRSALAYYTNIVFENAQGLAISGLLRDDIKNNTPTVTGLGEPFSILERVFKGQDVEVCYVSRSYLTRHGLGPIENECDADLISFSLHDETNVPNQFQGTLRYGVLNLETLIDRVCRDFELYVGDTAVNTYSKSLAFTHLNEFEPEGFDEFKKYAYQYGIEKLYLSDGYTADDVSEWGIF